SACRDAPAYSSPSWPSSSPRARCEGRALAARSRRTGAAGPEGARLAAAAALTLALLLAACGGPLAGGDPTMVTARLSANVPGAEAGGLSPQGFPYDPASGAIASTVRVYVFDEEGEQVSFQVSGTTYTAAPSGEEFITLTPEASSVTV